MRLLREVIRKEYKTIKPAKVFAVLTEQDVCACLKGVRRRGFRANLLDKKDFSFAVFVDKIKNKKFNAILDAIEENNITVYGDLSNKAPKFSRNPFIGIEEGDTLVFGKSLEYDVELASASRAYHNKDIGSIQHVYDLSKDINDILDAIDQFGALKKKANKKYPVNKESRTLRETLFFDGKVEKKQQRTRRKSKAKVEVSVTSNWVWTGSDFVYRNPADTVRVRGGNVVTTIPGCWYNA